MLLKQLNESWKSRSSFKTEMDKAYSDYRTKHSSSSMALMTRAEFAKDQMSRTKEPALHLMPTAGIKVQKFDGKKHDFAAAVSAQYGRPIIKKEGNKTYYLKQGRVVATMQPRTL